MGCSCTNTKVNEEEDDHRNYTTSYNTDIHEEHQIKILSEMLVNENKDDFNKHYILIETLGEGSFGKVYKVKQRTTNMTYAMKLVKKHQNIQSGQKNFLNEIYILRKLDHPNILNIFEYFSNEKYWFFVMEYCRGGDLYEKICEMKYYDEATAANIIKQLLSCVSYLNQLGIAHRDLKPENMMVNMKNEKEIEIKLIDFGTATYVKKGKKLSLKVGSPFYVAPEVLKGSYGLECDVWSCGIILYILLCGYPPFEGKNQEEIFDGILKKKINLNNDEWEEVSNEAKDLVSKLLEKDPNKRITAQEAIKHPFINKKSRKLSVADKVTKISLKNSLYNFRSKQKLHQAAIAFIVHQMSNNKMFDELKEIFKELDESGEGLLSKEELKKGYNKFFNDNLSDNEFDEIMKLIDQDKSGEISIEEFLRATVDRENLVTEKNLKLAFDYFDKDHSGSLTPDEVKDVLGLTDDNEKTTKIVNDIMKEIDVNGDGVISYDEFKLMMTNNNNFMGENKK
jgi:calcium-dependent protein kinase